MSKNNPAIGARRPRRMAPAKVFVLVLPALLMQVDVAFPAKSPKHLKERTNGNTRHPLLPLDEAQSAISWLSSPYAQKRLKDILENGKSIHSLLREKAINFEQAGYLRRITGDIESAPPSEIESASPTEFEVAPSKDTFSAERLIRAQTWIHEKPGHLVWQGESFVTLLGNILVDMGFDSLRTDAAYDTAQSLLKYGEPALSALVKLNRLSSEHASTLRPIIAGFRGDRRKAAASKVQLHIDGMLELIGRFSQSPEHESVALRPHVTGQIGRIVWELGAKRSVASDEEAKEIGEDILRKGWPAVTDMVTSGTLSAHTAELLRPVVDAIAQLPDAKRSKVFLFSGASGQTSTTPSTSTDQAIHRLTVDIMRLWSTTADGSGNSIVQTRMAGQIGDVVAKLGIPLLSRSERDAMGLTILKEGRKAVTTLVENKRLAPIDARRLHPLLDVIDRHNARESSVLLGQAIELFTPVSLLVDDFNRATSPQQQTALEKKIGEITQVILQNLQLKAEHRDTLAIAEEMVANPGATLTGLVERKQLSEADRVTLDPFVETLSAMRRIPSGQTNTASDTGEAPHWVSASNGIAKQLIARWSSAAAKTGRYPTLFTDGRIALQIGDLLTELGVRLPRHQRKTIGVTILEQGEKAIAALLANNQLTPENAHKLRPLLNLIDAHNAKMDSASIKKALDLFVPVSLYVDDLKGAKFQSTQKQIKEEIRKMTLAILEHLKLRAEPIEALGIAEKMMSDPATTLTKLIENKQLSEEHRVTLEPLVDTLRTIATITYPSRTQRNPRRDTTKYRPSEQTSSDSSALFAHSIADQVTLSKSKSGVEYDEEQVTIAFRISKLLQELGLRMSSLPKDNETTLGMRVMRNPHATADELVQQGLLSLADLSILDPLLDVLNPNTPALQSAHAYIVQSPLWTKVIRDIGAVHPERPRAVAKGLPESMSGLLSQIGLFVPPKHTDKSIGLALLEEPIETIEFLKETNGWGHLTPSAHVLLGELLTAISKRPRP